MPRRDSGAGLRETGDWRIWVSIGTLDGAYLAETAQSAFIRQDWTLPALRSSRKDGPFINSHLDQHGTCEEVLLRIDVCEE